MFTNLILSRGKNIYFYLLSWLTISVVYFILLYYGLQIPPLIAITDSLVFNLLLAGLGLSLWYPARYISFNRNKILKIIISHLISGLLTTALWLAIGYYLITFILNDVFLYSDFFYNTLVWRFIIGLLFYYLITSFYYIIIYYTGFQERAVRESELKNLVTEAELRSLKFQINPHFIFNSLNSMSALTTIEPERARSMILKLADFLRYTLANNEKQKNPLKDELKNIKLYLEIEKIRFEDKFDFIEDVRKDCLEVPVPNMILQPLFENAIKHAVYETLDKVILKLICKIENGYLVISLENNFEGTAIPKNGTGIGLKNISSRLELIYNQTNLMKVQKTENKFTVLLYIPIQHELIHLP